MDFKKFLPIALLAIFAVSSCKKNNNPTPEKAVDVYISGNTTALNGNSVATYWKNGVPIKLVDSLTNSQTDAITVQGNDVYVVGDTSTPNTLYGVATYWKNGVATKLTDGSSFSRAYAMAVQGNDIFVAGYTVLNNISKATYWKNGIATSLSDNSLGSIATAIVVSGSDVYVSGYAMGTLGYSVAIYWKNGVPTYLNTSSSDAVALVVDGNNVYTGGYIEQTAAAWKNGQIAGVQVNTLEGPSGIISAAVDGSDVYFTGFTHLANGSSEAIYWKNGVPTKLSNDGSISHSSEIAINGSDVYVSGYFTSNGITIGTYWKNGVAVKLGLNTNATGIAVVAH